METVSRPPHVVQTWTELTVGYQGGGGALGGEHDYTLRLELGDVFVNTPDRLAVTQVVGYRAPVTTEYARAWVTFSRICVRQVTVDPTTGAEILIRGGRPDGDT
jgi:hypothetical protein